MNAKQAIAMIRAMADSIIANSEYLTELDAAIGDGDHGINMARGFKNAIGKINSAHYELPSEVFKDISVLLMGSVGGSSGPLYGTFFIKFAMRFGSEKTVSPALFGEALSDGIAGVATLGKGVIGDKTMLDALIPASGAYSDAVAAGDNIEQALTKAIDAAEDGASSTIPLIARKGRASYLGERSVGHLDPGAASSVIILRAMLAGLKEEA